jgi:hypothetical protein
MAALKVPVSDTVKCAPSVPHLGEALVLLPSSSAAAFHVRRHGKAKAAQQASL